jgi:uncharacterized membrane protein YgcG
MSNSADGATPAIADRRAMTYLLTSIVPADRETFKKIVERVEPHARGLIARYTGMNERGIAITTVWESKAHSDRFTTEHLIPAVREIAGEGSGDGGGEGEGSGDGGGDGSGGPMIDFETFDEYHGTTSP